MTRRVSTDDEQLVCVGEMWPGRSEVARCMYVMYVIRSLPSHYDARQMQYSLADLQILPSAFDVTGRPVGRGRVRSSQGKWLLRAEVLHCLCGSPGST